MNASTDALINPVGTSINYPQIGDSIQRLPHYYHGRYIPSIHKAKVERFSRDGSWVRTGSPDSKLYHVPDVAFEEGYWQLMPENKEHDY
jgi:hypothetical protein